MKKFCELTAAQQEQAVAYCAGKVLDAIVTGGLRFNDALNHDDLQARIDAAGEKADKMRTPWFSHEYIMDTCKEEINGMARCEAEDALYQEQDDPQVIRLAVVEKTKIAA